MLALQAILTYCTKRTLTYLCALRVRFACLCPFSASARKGKPSKCVFPFWPVCPLFLLITDFRSFAEHLLALQAILTYCTTRALTYLRTPTGPSCLSLGLYCPLSATAVGFLCLLPCLFPGLFFRSFFTENANWGFTFSAKWCMMNPTE